MSGRFNWQRIAAPSSRKRWLERSVDSRQCWTNQNTLLVLFCELPDFFFSCLSSKALKYQGCLDALMAAGCKSNTLCVCVFRINVIKAVDIQD